MVDLFGNPIPTAKILDVRSGPDATTNGNIVVRVPDYLSVQNPADLSNLLTKKHQALLAYNAGYPNIVFDDLLDLIDVDLGAPNVSGSFGDRNIVNIFPGATFQSTVVPLLASPGQAVVTFETFSLAYNDSSLSRVGATYIEEASSPSNFTCDVSFDNGGHFYPTTDGGMLNIPLIGQGNQFIIRLTNVTTLPTRPLRVASWALLYLDLG
jgi:hypothetical protein